MKDILLISVVFMLLLSGCNRYARADIPAEGTFHLALINNTDIDVYGYEVSYFQDGTLRGGSGGGQYADNSKIKKGDTFTLDFNHVNFLPNKEVTFEITVYTGKHQMEKVTLKSPVITMISSLESTYYLNLTGNSVGNLAVN
ncbi:hypothetical protein AB685_15400 [Bacillus sp. LL01]|uniref:hypothetical protein n=1 Tax=Bacillus sp. LL01 TaxID=1665556 RepID=UPI00064D2AAB|nr:hypothetical protein [Bacillus sp. LL01]KMJ57414.1 hypothetical protein AB685_15400 [Bacillus sp. LL01]